MQVFHSSQVAHPECTKFSARNLSGFCSACVTSAHRQAYQQMNLQSNAAVKCSVHLLLHLNSYPKHLNVNATFYVYTVSHMFIV